MQSSRVISLLRSQHAMSMAAVLPIQEAYLAALRQGKTAVMTALAQKEDRASHAELNRLRAMPANNECFDCTATKPGWAVLPHGIFVCIDCAQAHRNLGRHISQTKAINTGTYLWYPHELAVMREVGNARAGQWYRAAPAKPSRDASAAEKEAYARDKYERRRWGPIQEPLPAPMLVPAMASAPLPVASASGRPSVSWKEPVVERTMVTPVAMPLKRPQSGGLAHAKRISAATALTTTMADLISLDEDVDGTRSAKPSLPVSPQVQPAGGWATDWPDLSDAHGADGMSSMGAEPAATISPDLPPAGGWATDWPAVWEAPGAGGAWDSKKAAVLSQFAWDTKKEAVLSQFAQAAANNGRSACGPSMGSPALFFASYGL